MIYHLLDEPFSAYNGLAVASVVSNIMRFDESGVVVCPQADDTWGFSADRIMVIPQLSKLNKMMKIRGWRFVPLEVRIPLICHFFSTLLSKVEAGDIVWCHNWAYVAAALERIIHSKRAKLVYHAHNSLAFFKKRPVFQSFVPDALIFNSEAMRQEALTFLPFLKNTCVIHNGANDALFYPPSADTARNDTVPVILYVGRLLPIKGVHVLIEAMRILHERNIKAICKVVGSSRAGGPKGKSTAYIDSLHDRCPPNVRFEGFRSGNDIAEEYRSADILCCPSIWQEPFGNVNVEAMACALPVVASRVGGIPEIASEGGVLLVEPDSAVDLADALEKLLLDKDLRSTMGAEGLASFRRRFTWSAIVKQHRNLVDSLQESQICAG